MPSTRPPCKVARAARASRSSSWPLQPPKKSLYFPLVPADEPADGCVSRSKEWKNSCHEESTRGYPPCEGGGRAIKRRRSRNARAPVPRVHTRKEIARSGHAKRQPYPARQKGAPLSTCLGPSRTVPVDPSAHRCPTARRCQLAECREYLHELAAFKGASHSSSNFLHERAVTNASGASEVAISNRRRFRHSRSRLPAGASSTPGRGGAFQYAWVHRRVGTVSRC